MIEGRRVFLPFIQIKPAWGCSRAPSGSKPAREAKIHLKNVVIEDEDEHEYEYEEVMQPSSSCSLSHEQWRSALLHLQVK